MKNRTIIGIFCIILSAVTMFGITPLVNTIATGKVEVVQVVKRIDPGQVITAEDVKKVQIGSFGVKDNAIKDEKELVGKYAAVNIMPNNCIYSDMLTEKADSADFVFRELNGTQIAISISIANFANGLSGKLQNGDIVSAIIVSENESTIPVELTYLRVITTTTSKGTDSDKIFANEEGNADLPTTVTLMVSPAQAKLLALHDRKSDIYLSLVYRGDTKTAQKFLDAQDIILKKESDKDE